MTKVFFCSDLHLGHENILKFSPETRNFNSIAEHDQYIIDEWTSKVTKRDLVWCLGDMAYKSDHLKLLKDLPGNKRLVRGNHDQDPLENYLEIFDDIQSMFRYKGFWVTHCPMHPDELYGRRNIHGHVHTNTVKTPTGGIDNRYINICMENRANLGGHTIVPFDFILDKYDPRVKKKPKGANEIQSEVYTQKPPK